MKNRWRLGHLSISPSAIVYLALAILLSGCATEPKDSPSSSDSSAYSARAPYNRPYTVKGRTYYPLTSAKGYREHGTASWYGWESGNRTATGARFNPRELTAAHRTLPLPTRVRVTNLDNKRSIEVLVNDRGPFVNGHLIDLSHAAAKALNIKGHARVELVAME